MSIFISRLAKFLHYFLRVWHCLANFPAVPSVLNKRKIENWYVSGEFFSLAGVCLTYLGPYYSTWNLATQSVNFGRHLTEILYPFEISYQIFIHTLPYQYLSFRNFTLPKFSFKKSYLTKIFFSEMLKNFTIIKVSVNLLYVNVTLVVKYVHLTRLWIKINRLAGYKMIVSFGSSAGL